MASLGSYTDAPTTSPAASAAPLSGALPFGWPLLLYGVRMWGAVCLALFIAFKLELENPFWAGTTAAIVCQPVLGASLRKGWFRLIGTVLGAIAVVVLTACFPQSRVGFLLTLALWGAVCAFTSTVLRNFASYAAALAGYTCVIVAGDELGAVGGANGDAFNLAITRATEICLGIVCAGFVLASTDLGSARRRLAKVLSVLACELTTGLFSSLSAETAARGGSRPARQALFRRLTGLPVMMDQTAGEMSFMRFHPRTLQLALDGLFAGLSSWRVVATHREHALTQEGQQEADGLLAQIPHELRGLSSIDFETRPLPLRDLFLATARDLVRLSAPTASLRLLADRIAQALIGVARALRGIALLNNPERDEAHPRTARLRVPDLLPAVLNAVRAFVTIVVAELVWVWTAWPNGSSFIVFAAITVILFAPREDAAFGMAQNFMLGTTLTAVLAAIITFAVLPTQPTFAGFCAAIGLILVPAGVMSAQSWRQPLFVALAANFIPLLGPANVMTYDPEQFYNLTMGLLGGVALAMFALRVIPPLPPALRARRLLTLALRDLRRIAAGTHVPSLPRWEARGFSWLAAMPDTADSLQQTRLAAALSLGSEMIRVRRVEQWMALPPGLDRALRAIAHGDSAAAVAELRRFAAGLPGEPEAPARMRLRATVLAIAETLPDHADYLDASIPR